MWSLNTYPLDCKLPAHSVCEDLELLFHSAYPLSNASVRNAEKCHRLQHMLGSQLQRRPQLQRRSAGTGPFFWQAPTLDVQMTVEKIWISLFIYSTLQWPGVCRTRRQRANFMTFSTIVYHIPSQHITVHWSNFWHERTAVSVFQIIISHSMAADNFLISWAMKHCVYKAFVCKRFCYFATWGPYP